MVYIVNEGQQVDDGTRSYGPGSFLPGSKGDLADMEEVGVVSWRDAGAKGDAVKAPRKRRVRRKAAAKDKPAAKMVLPPVNPKLSGKEFAKLPAAVKPAAKVEEPTKSEEKVPPEGGEDDA